MKISKLLLIVATILVSSWLHGNEAACIEFEKQALLTFKQELIDQSNRLSSWVDDVDCCFWEGVVCNNITNHVIELHLRNPYESFRSDLYNFDNFIKWQLTGRLDPSLLNLTQLQFLDLSLNDFQGYQIPPFIGSLKNLFYLNLSYSGFGGNIPPELGNLTNLHTLSVTGYERYPSLHAENLQWVTSLSRLEHLDMRYVNLSKESNWLQVINMIPSLTELHLSWCNLYLDSDLVGLNLSSLGVLDLSGNSFGSFIPKWIFGLSTLASLNLSSNELEVSFLPQGPWNLTSLTNLDLSKNNLNGSLPRELFNLYNLNSLHLSHNRFNDLIPSTANNLTNLQSLHVAFNNLSATASVIPDWLYDLKGLRSLNLSGNHLQGAIPDRVGNVTSIIDLDLSKNELTGRIPSARNLCNIRLLDLSSNKLEGPMAEVVDGMSGCFADSVQKLFLSSNKLSGHLTDQMGHFKNLLHLDFSGNSISGPIPSNIGSLSSLKTLHLGGNKFNGTLPRSLGHLSKLVELNISFNMMEGDVTDIQFYNLTSLRYMWAAGNSLTLKVEQDWIPVTRFVELDLRYWKLGPQFPMWLHTQTEIFSLDLSFTGISDAIPSWIWNLSTNFWNLNLSHNQLQGEVRNICCIKSAIDLSSNNLSGQLHPMNSTDVGSVFLSHNSFSGGLSQFLCDKENQNLRGLHLSDNLLSEEIPDCWMNWQWLTVIDLDNNNLSGSIPRSMQFPFLTFLHLRNNSLSGVIPWTLQTCKELRTLNLAENNFTGDMPTWLGLSLSKLMILILRSNNFSGELPPELCHLTSFRILDVGHNNFSGVIPSCFKNFTSMKIVQQTPYGYVAGYQENVDLTTKGNEYSYGTILPLVTAIDLSSNNFSGKIPEELTDLLGLKYLNLSGNHLEGIIPRFIGQMQQLESLDLSRNRLSGQIPSSISQLSFLNFLNLSYNNLSGQIPLSTQMQSFDPSRFFGNDLCGLPLTKNCSSSPDNGGNAIEEESAEHGVDWLYIFIGLGYVVGLSGVCLTLIFKKSWRRAYFLFVEEVWYRIHDFGTKFIMKRGLKSHKRTESKG